MTEDEAHTTEFQFENNDETEQADVYVDETFVNGYNDQRAYLDGDTYEAKEAIKFDWNTMHHDFDGNSKRWIVDGDDESLAALEAELNDAGFTFDADPGSEREESALFDVHAFAEEGDDIEVVYEQKNGEGMNAKTGEVVDVSYNSGYEDKPMIAFRRHSDNHYMYVQFDKWGKESLYTGGSTSPFVGAVERVTVTTEDDREVPTTDAEPAEEEPTADEPTAADLPWNNGADA